MADTVRKSNGAYNVAYLVLGGDGWTLRDYYVSGQLEEYMHNIENVFIVKFESFIAKANSGQL
ncbi:MAG: hypothetical protein K6T83_16205 [Alicyclobacillus sp.]|nr:hypothetical protein [Alicyclobacillus sp.]